MDSWRKSTKKLYTTYLNKWATFCVQKGIDLCNPTLPQACRFLRMLSDSGSSYAAVNSARCAMSTILPKIDGHTFGEHDIVCRLLKGVYERNPPKPRYAEFWDVNKVFMLFKSWDSNTKLTLKLLSMKLAVLLLLVTSQRGQTIINLSIDDLILSDVAIFRLKKLLKHNRVGDPLDTVKLRSFDQCKKLCVVRTLKVYLRKTQFVRSYSALLLSYVRPHKPISRDTLSRWTLSILRMAGVDTSKFKSHSIRGASTSAAKRLGIPINVIMRQASWKSVQSFAKYYDKRLEDETVDMQNVLLQNVH